ncbi:hypothetical protein L1987_88449 [Smallanthus sonchifolius]|nr:hypothetical protein L1987_89237 [Smallanthus sonchifolius]KAI3666367.1 hypothetical protein L1987_89129 [Smallanthus sonchifolius]KAI3668549.1 hypothetical protein L1987_88449 [Smallanthus sonchifolius]
MKSLRYFVPQLGSLATYPSPPLAIDLSHSVQAVEFRFFPNREREIFAAARSRSSSKDYNSIRDRQNSGKLERPMWGTFWVWDARLTSVLISFLIYMGALRFQKLPIEPAPISIRAGPIDIPIIKSSVNWWNTSHQPGSISRYGTSIHVPMPIPILSNFANSPFSTRILFVLETRLLIPSFLESPLTEEIEAQEGIPKPSSLAESLCIHG